jgi:beta-galactosidase/beta-glucuronidase
VLTRWGRVLDADHPLPEYPRPQLVRERWLNLNGRWEHAFTRDDRRPDTYAGPIVVPFSPEAELSGVGRQLQPDEWLWYRREFTRPEGERVLLHFGAVDQTCTVWVNGIEQGSHIGGYLPFSFDVTQALIVGDNVLEVRVRDLSETGVHARGKQRLDRGEIWYTAQSGIWQTVWLEPVPHEYIEHLVLVPHLESAELEVTVVPSQSVERSSSVERSRDHHATVELAGTTTTVAVGEPTRLPVADPRAWTPEDPYLYDLTVTMGQDRVTSYAAMRSFGVSTSLDGRNRLLLNGEPFAHVGVLDQGYWPDGLLTAPSDEAMVHDIETMADLGFTVLRKHVKIEPLRWYYHCDRLGLVVWQDMVNGGGRYRWLTAHRPARRFTPIPDRLYRLFGRADRDGRAEFRREVRETVELLRNTVSVAVWTVFNEAWGQFGANALARELARLDPTRTVNHACGWIDQGGGDIRSFHCYLAPFEMPRRQGRRVLALSEYGGASMRTDGHDWSDREYGYLHLADRNAFTAQFETLHEPLVQAAREGLAATVYTQLSDVEDELNGLLTWDREVLKLDPDVVRRTTAALKAAMETQR